MSCRGCGGTGIDASVSPRAAQLAEQPVLMRKTSGVIEGGGTSNVFRGNVSHQFEVGRMRFQGPLTLLIERVEQRRKQGYEIVEGDVPDSALACQWCNGYGSPDGQLTVRALEKLASS